MKPTTIGQEELDRFLQVSRTVFKRASVATPRGRAILATPPAGLYPFIYTRDLAVMVAGLCELGAVDTARDLCRFLLRVQDRDGCWVQRYDTEGRPVPAQREEDATALAIWALMTYARAANDETLVEVAREPIDRATRYTCEQTLNPYLYLVETTVSLHQTDSAAGYDLWNNCAHAAAFALCHRIYGGERFRRLGLMIRRAISVLMVQDNRFLRRLDQSGYPDPRPDVSLMAPFFFGLWSPSERAVINSAELIERTLWNVEIGGYVRFLPYSRADRTVMPGPWPRFAAWMAQFHYGIGNQDRAEAILRWLFDNLIDGEVPETIIASSTIRRFAPEYRVSAVGSQSVADPPSQLAIDVTQARRRQDLDRLERLSAVQETVPANVPHLASHVELLRALKRGGYVERWEFEPTAHRLP